MRLMALFFLAAIPVLAGPAYPLKRSANNRFLVDQNNVPFLLIGDSPQSLMANLSPSQMAAYMADRQAKGFNTLWVYAIPGNYNGGVASGAAQDGTVPFTSPSPGTQDTYNFATPNPAYWAEVDAMVNLAASYGFVVDLFPWDTGLTSPTDGWLIAARACGATCMYNYGVWIGNRYKNFPNIIWSYGTDFQAWSTNSTDNNLVYQTMLGVASADPNHLQTIELNYNYSYSGKDTLLTPVLGLNHDYVQTSTYDEMLAAYNSSPKMPVILGEGNYEFENNTGALSPWPGGPPPVLPNPTYDLIPRLQAWWALTSGGVGEIYGNHYVWTLSGPMGVADWTKYLDSVGAGQIQYINSFFNAIPWWNLVPDQTHQIVTAGYGTYVAASGSGNMLANNYATTAWVTDGSLAVVYDPAGNALTVNMAKFNSSVLAQWYDPTDGTYTTISGSPFSNSGSDTFATPGSNHTGKSDWVLLLQAAASANKPTAPTGLTATIK